ncbi:hypothetical protein [Phenylobacterium sp.]|jgi:hypothetical protein|uniref:hypothetical protein n=1 Tax=Phenylobacterium sp. TaxID=1871053 RepID=UPI002F95E577
MPRILTTCPASGQTVATNLSMDASTFRIVRLEGQSYTCPACQVRHPWSQDEAWLEPLAEKAAPAS